MIFFVMSALSNINSMYEYSLLSYLSDVYRVALRKREPSMSVDTKLENIIKLLTEIAYDYTCMGIFERHKDMFAFQLAIGYVLVCILFSFPFFNSLFVFHFALLYFDPAILPWRV